MDFDSVKRFLEKEDGGENESTIDSMPAKFIEPFVSHGLKVDLIEPGRLICSLKVPPRLVDSGNLLHGGAMATLVDLLGSLAFHTDKLETFHSGVSVDINVSFADVAVLGEEIEIESKVLRVGKTICVASVELRKKEAGKIIAQGRHTKYLGIRKSASKLDDEQWLAYWILYSFLTLAEMLLQPILQWIPIWYDVKLVFVGWLVLPQFRGAAFIYEKFVREKVIKKYVPNLLQRNGMGKTKFVNFVSPNKGGQEAY